MKAQKIECGMCELLKLSYSTLQIKYKAKRYLEYVSDVTDVKYCPRCGKRLEVTNNNEFADIMKTEKPSRESIETAICVLGEEIEDIEIDLKENLHSDNFVQSMDERIDSVNSVINWLREVANREV